MIRKFILPTLLLAPIGLWAQANTWEQPEEETVAETPQANPDAKYLKGAVPIQDGKVVFTSHVDAPGKSAAQVYDIIHRYLLRMLSEKNQLGRSRLIVADSIGHRLAGGFEEWLVFKATSINLDRTRLYYTLEADCHEGGAELRLSHIRYLYEEQRDPQRYTAEEWITDEEAVNKKNTRLYPLSGKFRRKTIDRKDYLFNKIETLLK